MIQTNRSNQTLIRSSRSAILALALTAAAGATSIPYPSGAHGNNNAPSSAAAVTDWDSYRCGLGWNEPAFPGKPPIVPPGLEDPRHPTKPPKQPISSVPEPGSMALMAIGLLGFLGVRRFRRGAGDRRSR